MKGWVARLAGQKNLAAGLAMGVAGVLLAWLGNPRNTGICVSCFAENVAGSLRLHGDQRMTYLRPEFMGFLLGATVMALGRGKFRPRGGSSPFIRFLVGILLIVGSTIFLGCPIKVVLRMAAGDVTALPGVAGLVGGVWLGVLFLRRGFFLGKGVKTRPLAGWILPSFMVLLTAGAFWGPVSFRGGLVGAAAEHAPLLASLGLGGVVGALSQRSSFCVTGGVRNFYLTRDPSMLSGVAALFLSALAHLGRQGHISIAKHKSNREYAAELDRRAHDQSELVSAFGRNVSLFEQVWYGKYLPTEAALAVFREDHGILLGGCSEPPAEPDGGDNPPATPASEQQGQAANKEWGGS